MRYSWDTSKICLSMSKICLIYALHELLAKISSDVTKYVSDRVLLIQKLKNLNNQDGFSSSKAGIDYHLIIKQHFIGGAINKCHIKWKESKRGGRGQRQNQNSLHFKFFPI